MRKRIKFEESSGNVFSDLSIDDGEPLQVVGRN